MKWKTNDFIRIRAGALFYTFSPPPLPGVHHLLPRSSSDLPPAPVPTTAQVSSLNRVASIPLLGKLVVGSPAYPE